MANFGLFWLGKTSPIIFTSFSPRSLRGLLLRGRVGRAPALKRLLVVKIARRCRRRCIVAVISITAPSTIGIAITANAADGC